MIVTGNKLLTGGRLQILLPAVYMRNLKQTSNEQDSVSGKTSLFLSERETDLPRVNQFIQ
jgi:hypothetical protein